MTGARTLTRAAARESLPGDRGSSVVARERLQFAKQFAVGVRWCGAIALVAGARRERTQARRIDIPHELADELHLPLASTPRRDRTALAQRLDKPLRQFDLGGKFVEPLRIEQDQGSPQILQRLH